MKVHSIAWSEAFSVGHPLMDQQHQNLVEMLNQMVAHFNAGQPDAALPILVQFLQAVELHFKDEEQLLAAQGYTSLEAQVRSHSNYQDNFSRLIANGFSDDSDTEEHWCPNV